MRILKWDIKSTEHFKMINKLDNIKIKNFYSTNDISKSVKKHLQSEGKHLSICIPIFDKELITRIYNKFLPSSKLKTI